MGLSKHYIVQLCHGCWLAEWQGDPGRTLRIENAQRFDSRRKAQAALARARKFRDFPDAFIDVLTATVL